MGTIDNATFTGTCPTCGQAYLTARVAELEAGLHNLESWRLAALAGSATHGGYEQCLRDFKAARALYLAKVTPS